MTNCGFHVPVNNLLFETLDRVSTELRLSVTPPSQKVRMFSGLTDFMLTFMLSFISSVVIQGLRQT